MDDQTHARVGDYEILGVLGAGGMGKVYKVRNVISDRVEAMKVLLPDLADRRALADRFLREIKLLATLNHPNIASLRTALTWGNQLVMIMEYVEGVTLSALLRRGPIAPMQVVDYISQALSALAYAHSLHIIHRDIKPTNMMVTQQGVVKLMDFGIARSQGDPVLTQSGGTLGSLQYMSPEQVRGEPADERSDLYSIGVSLYELTTGQRPFRADNEYAVMLAHLQTPPPPPINLRPDMPAVLNDIILMAMAKDQAQRFQSATAMRNALQTMGLAAAGSAAQPSSPLPDAAIPSLEGADITARPEKATGECASPPSAVIRAAMRGSSEVGTPFSRPAQMPPVPEAPPRPAAVAATPIPVTASSAQLAEAAGQPQAQIASHVPVVQAPSTGASQSQPGSLPLWQGGSTAPNLAPQPPSPVLVPPKPDVPLRPSAHRGLYIALGSVIVLGVLVAAGLYVPRMSRAHASGETSTSVGRAQPSAAPSFQMPAQSENSGQAPAALTEPEKPVQPQPPAFDLNRPSEVPRALNSETPNASAPAGNANRGPGSNDFKAVRTSPSAGGTSNAFSTAAVPRQRTKRGASTAQTQAEAHERAAMNEPSPNATPPSRQQQDKELEQLEHDADLLTGRAEAVDGSLETLRQSQAAQGLGLRGDITASQQRMRSYITRAQMALKNGDPERAKRFLTLADTEVTSLEKFLGR